MKQDDQLQPLDLFNDPWLSFQTWFKMAKDGGQVEPEAMALATADKAGHPSVRMVLMRRMLTDGLCFFTNYQSNKAQDLSENPFASAMFHWRSPFHRQIRIFGTVKKTSAEVSDEYYNSRAYQSRISAWASPQSRRVLDRDFLTNEHIKFEKVFEGKELKRPEYWGGFEIRPERFEFWQERPHRFHDRIVFQHEADGWKWERLGP